MSRVSPALREKVRQRADGRCEYCRNGSTDLDNLAWACFDCNTNKGSDLSAYDDITKQLTPLYNPRTQKWDEHFEVNNAIINGKTDVGRVTVRLLQMNDPDRVETRRELIEANLW
jgi:hypothetical protein